MKLPPYRRVLIALPPGLLDRLDSYAGHLEISRAEAVRRALDAYITLVQRERPLPPG